jgi:hypothetical protein
MGSAAGLAPENPAHPIGYPEVGRHAVGGPTAQQHCGVA